MSLAFLIVGPRDLEPDRFAKQRFERRNVPVRGPEFQFGVSGRP
jgi:hypothetical protein